jgi:acetylornithine deacetylase
VRIPSVSGEEQACRDALAAWLGEHGVTAHVAGRNVWASVEGLLPAPPERGLLLLTHVDVVPVGPGWTREPWDGALEGGRVFGRGSNDAKASVAAMAWALAHLDRARLAGRVVVALVCDEETGGQGIETLGGVLPPYDAAVVGEPTELDVCPGQRGLLRATLEVTGRSCHASRPWEGVNAIEKAARDVLAVQGLDLGPPDPDLGPPTLQCTVIHGGTKPNVLPGSCTIELDGRSTPGCDNTRMLHLLRAAVGAQVVVKSTRFQPVRTKKDAAIVKAAEAASPTGKVRPFGGVSDLFHVRHVPGVVMGPGTSAASHSPDESVAVEQVEAAARTYAAVAARYLVPA